MTLVCYVPARTGSKRLKNKNFINFSNGISITEIALRKSKEIKGIKYTLLDTNNSTFLENMKSKVFSLILAYGILASSTFAQHGGQDTENVSKYKTPQMIAFLEETINYQQTIIENYY